MEISIPSGGIKAACFGAAFVLLAATGATPAGAHKISRLTRQRGDFPWLTGRSRFQALTIRLRSSAIHRELS